MHLVKILVPAWCQRWDIMPISYCKCQIISWTYQTHFMFMYYQKMKCIIPIKWPSMAISITSWLYPAVSKLAGLPDFTPTLAREAATKNCNPASDNAISTCFDVVGCQAPNGIQWSCHVWYAEMGEIMSLHHAPKYQITDTWGHLGRDSLSKLYFSKWLSTKIHPQALWITTTPSLPCRHLQEPRWECCLLSPFPRSQWFVVANPAMVVILQPQVFRFESCQPESCFRSPSLHPSHFQPILRKKCFYRRNLEDRMRNFWQFAWAWWTNWTLTLTP